MNFTEFQKVAHSFASYGDNPMYAYLGLAEEAGEVAGKVAKFIRHNDGLAPQCGFNYALKSEKDSFARSLKKELGDVLWFVAEIATINGMTLDDIAEQNVGKLADRKKRGVIDGSGDDR